MSLAIERDRIAVEMASTPLTGTAFMRFTPVRGGTRVFIEYDAGDCDNSKHYDENALSEFVGNFLDQTYNRYLRYLSIDTK